MSVFYDIYNKSLEDQTKILRESKNNCHVWQYDILDCTKSFSRMNVVTSSSRNDEESFEEVMRHFDSGCHVVFIDRQGLGTWNRPECWEIGFCTISSGADHFLFIHVEPQVAYDLVEKYNLKVIDGK